MRRGLAWAFLCLVGAVAPGGSALALPTFRGLDVPYLPLVIGASVDGSILAGTLVSDEPETTEAYRWTAAAGMVGLGYLPGGHAFSFANAISADGSTVVGDASSGSGNEAFRWTAGEGIVGLGDLPGGPFESFALDVSADGSAVVGYSKSSSLREAYRWTAAEGMVGLGTLPGAVDSGATAISADGQTVVGGSGDVSITEAFRWTSDEGMVGLGHLSEARFSIALAASADGSVIVGYDRAEALVVQAFRWTDAEGMVGLGDVPGGSVYSIARGVSADGSIVVGDGTSVPGFAGGEPFIWDAQNGTRRLIDVLINDYGLGAELSGWRLLGVKNVSSSGPLMTIAGFGLAPDGLTSNWIAQIPEPSTRWLVATALAALGLLRRRGSRRSFSR
jgi:probable HAF family extracellular repeat protein